MSLTASVMADVRDIPERDAQSVEVDMRIFNLLAVGQKELSRFAKGESEGTYSCSIPVGSNAAQQNYVVKVVAGPGDRGELVLTFMRPGED